MTHVTRGHEIPGLAHGALYRFSTTAELDGRFDADRSWLNHDVTQREFISPAKRESGGGLDGRAADMYITD